MNKTAEARIAKFETAAREMLAAGFATKAAQTRARQAVSASFEISVKLVRDVHLAIPFDDRTHDQTDLYFELPAYPHEWRAKHADAVRSLLPAAATHIPTIDRLCALAAEIKAAPTNAAPASRLSAESVAVPAPTRSAIVCNGKRMTITLPSGEKVKPRATARIYKAALLVRNAAGQLVIASAHFELQRAIYEASTGRYGSVEVLAVAA